VNLLSWLETPSSFMRKTCSLSSYGRSSMIFCWLVEMWNGWYLLTRCYITLYGWSLLPHFLFIYKGGSLTMQTGCSQILLLLGIEFSKTWVMWRNWYVSFIISRKFAIHNTWTFEAFDWFPEFVSCNTYTRFQSCFISLKYWPMITQLTLVLHNLDKS